MPWLTPFVIMRLSGFTSLIVFSSDVDGSAPNMYCSVRKLATASRVVGEPHRAT